MEPDLREEVFKKLEAMLRNREGILPICVNDDCKKIGIDIGEKRHWISREENPEIYDRSVSHYNMLFKQNKGGLSHTYCFSCEAKAEEEFGL